MKLEENTFKSGLKKGRSENQVGLWISMCQGMAAEAIGWAGFDWALVDMEHTPNDLSTVTTQFQALASTGTPALVRPPWNEPVVVKRLLDIGARSILFPMVQTPEEAAQAVAACRYPPEGIRGVAGTMRANRFGRYSDYFERINDEIAVLVQLETASAIAQASEIAAVDGVDGVFFGPADIGADLGKLGNPMDPAVWELLAPVSKKLIEDGVAVGTLVSDVSFATQLFNDGYNYVACGTDMGLLNKSADNLVADMRKKLA